MLYDNEIKSFLSENCNYAKLSERKVFNEILSEDQHKIQFTDKVIATMYELMMRKYAGIDFGTIPDSKGNFSRLREYDTLTKCMEAINYCFRDSRTPGVEYANTLNESISLLENYTREFSLAFVQDNEMIQTIYNTLVTSVICGINFTISFLVDYIITPDGELNTNIETRKKLDSKDYILFKNLNVINEKGADGTLKRLFTSSLKSNAFIGSMALGAGVGVGTAIAVGAILIIPAIRELVYLIFNLRMKISEFLNLQAEFLDLNIIEIRSNSSMSAKDKTAIIKKQREQIKRLQKLSDKFELNFNRSYTATDKEVSKKINPSELKASINDIGLGGNNTFGLI